MDELINRIKNPKVLFEGEVKSFSEAGALLIKRMIEEDLPKSSYCPDGVDPYKWLTSIMDKTERTIRGWAYDWDSPSGKKPTIHDFFCLISIIGSGRAYTLLKNLGSGLTPEEQSKQYGNMIKTVADHIRKLVEDLDELAQKYEDEDSKEDGS